jgi:hypothetical protein
MRFKNWLKESVIPLGDCFRWATKTAIDKFLDGTVVHGLVKTKENPIPYYHAWIEHNDRVYDWQMQIDNWKEFKGIPHSMSYNEFKKKFKILKQKRYKPAATLGIMYKEKNWGPWGNWSK